jgi:hypothetical protein
MKIILILLVMGGVASLLGALWSWFAAFAAGMSDSPSAAADMAPGPFALFGLPALAVALFVAAWFVQ